jgi:DNA polymerase I-like protein with 3'-5' exonuclease and polymerase domains
MPKLKPIVLDFETDPIQPRPEYPPAPVSFSLKLPEWRTPKFFAWGHKTGGNNCNRKTAESALKAAYDRLSEQEPLLCFNAKFDMDVALEHFGLPVPDWRHFHDAMFLLFLHDPHQRALGLKPASARLLNMPETERDAVADWIIQHQDALLKDHPAMREHLARMKPTVKSPRITMNGAGAFISWAPGNVVESYANGDVIRTLKMFELLCEDVTVKRGMRDAYDRERRVLPIFLRNEREGLKVDTAKLEQDQDTYEAAQAKTDTWLRKALKSPTLDFNKDADVATAFEKASAVTEWSRTATGRLSVSKKNLKLTHFKDPKVAAAYSYRQRCATILETFIRPWRQFGASGQMHTTWNQVRQTKGGMGDTGGTRTGRPSSDSPNFLNMPKAFKEGGIGEYVFPAHITGLPQLPKVRSYILPDEKGHVIGRRDFAQQELRILGHFEDGALLQAYLENPLLDVHEFARAAIEDLIGLDVGRGVTKTLNFGYIYGQGLGSLAEKLDRTVEDVKSFRDAQMAAIPGLKKLSDDIKARSARDLPIRTWGGREYYVEPKQWSEKYDRWQTFEYKLLNYLIQGSAADITKESLIRYEEVRRDGRLMLTVYDENNISVPKKAAKHEMLLLREAMMSIELDIPLMSDGEVGPNLGELVALDEPAPDLSRWGMSQ